MSYFLINKNETRGDNTAYNVSFFITQKSLSTEVELTWYDEKIHKDKLRNCGPDEPYTIGDMVPYIKE